VFALTRRLTLRPGWPEDAPALATAIAHASVVRNLARAPWPYTVADAAAFLALPRDAHQPRFQIITRGENRLIGGVELVADEAGAHELGYWLTPDAWGQGYASDAARAVIDIARHTLRLDRLVARHMIDNPASGRVLHKLGFVETGRGRLRSLARDAEVDTVEFALDLAESCAPPLPIAA